MIIRLGQTEYLAAIYVLFVIVVVGCGGYIYSGVSEVSHSAVQSARALERSILVFDDAVQSRIYSIAHRDMVVDIYRKLGTDSQRKVSWLQLMRDVEEQSGVHLRSFDISAREEVSHESTRPGAGHRTLGYQSLKLEATIQHEELLVELIQWIDANAPSQFEITRLSLDTNTSNNEIELILSLRWYLLDDQGENNA